MSARYHSSTSALLSSVQSMRERTFDGTVENKVCRRRGEEKGRAKKALTKTGAQDTCVVAIPTPPLKRACVHRRAPPLRLQPRRPLPQRPLPLRPLPLRPLPLRPLPLRPLPLSTAAAAAALSLFLTIQPAPNKGQCLACNRQHHGVNSLLTRAPASACLSLHAAALPVQISTPGAPPPTVRRLAAFSFATCASPAPV